MAAFERRTHYVDVAYTLKGVVDAAIGELDDNFLNRFVESLRIDAVCRAEPAGKLKLTLVDIDRDYA